MDLEGESGAGVGVGTCTSCRHGAGNSRLITLQWLVTLDTRIGLLRGVEASKQ